LLFKTNLIAHAKALTRLAWAKTLSATGDYTSAIGANSTASGFQATAVGAVAAATNGSVAIGAFAKANATNGVAIRCGIECHLA
jgi:hypothetical protein